MLLFFLIIDFSITAAIVQTFNPIAELVTPTGMQKNKQKKQKTKTNKKNNKETKAEIEIHPVIVEAKIRKCST